MNVGDIMMPASKIDASSTVTEAARFMAEHNTHSVFVESQGKVKGIVTESDIVRKVVTQGIDSRRIMVYDIMTSPVVSVGKETSLEDASELMTRHKIRRLAIVEKGRIDDARSADEGAQKIRPQARAPRLPVHQEVIRKNIETKI